MRLASFSSPAGRPPWLQPEPLSLLKFHDKLYFGVDFEDGHAGLWTSDGTSAGTLAVKTFPESSGSSSDVDQLTLVGEQLFFVARDAAHGRELWVSDGTSAGTRLVEDLTPGAEDTSPSGLSAVGSQLLFFRFVPETSNTPGHTELWSSDGTAAGTRRLKDLGPDSAPGSERLVLEGTLYFDLSDSVHGSELWKSDGTEAGTQLVRDIAPGAASAYPGNLRAVGHDVFFLAGASPGHQLWRTDGTTAGTVLVEDLDAGGDTGYAALMGTMGNTLYLALSTTSDQLMRLYAVNPGGSSGASRQLVATLPNAYATPGQDALPILANFAVAEDQLFFGLAITSSGPAPRDVQLWATRGTQGDTRQLVRPLSLSDEFQSEIYALDDRVLLAASTQAAGLEPWVSDGTSQGTHLLQDLSPGASSSFPHAFTRVGSAVFFVAYDSTNGNSLWVFPPNS